MGNSIYYSHFIAISVTDSNTLAHTFLFSGLICVYSNQQSFETLKDNLERTLLCNLELEDKFENLPIVLVYQPQDLKENEVEYLRNEGMRLSEMLHCDFIDHTQNHQKYVYDILNIVILSLRTRGLFSNSNLAQGYLGKSSFVGIANTREKVSSN